MGGKLLHCGQWPNSLDWILSRFAVGCAGEETEVAGGHFNLFGDLGGDLPT
jgi:hypothetical protein